MKMFLVCLLSNLCCQDSNQYRGYATYNFIDNSKFFKKYLITSSFGLFYISKGKNTGSIAMFDTKSLNDFFQINGVVLKNNALRNICSRIFATIYLHLNFPYFSEIKESNCALGIGFHLIKYLRIKLLYNMKFGSEIIISIPTKYNFEFGVSAFSNNSPIHNNTNLATQDYIPTAQLKMNSDYSESKGSFLRQKPYKTKSSASKTTSIKKKQDDLAPSLTREIFGKRNNFNKKNYDLYDYLKLFRDAFKEARSIANPKQKEDLVIALGYLKKAITIYREQYSNNSKLRKSLQDMYIEISKIQDPGSNRSSILKEFSTIK